MKSNKEKLNPSEALDLIRRKVDQEMRYRWKMWKNPLTAHEYYAVSGIRRFVKNTIKRVSKDILY